MAEKRSELIQTLTSELQGARTCDSAIALDLDGVCKLFTQHKHQIMKTFLFLNLVEFQRVPFKIFDPEYVRVNFNSEYAGKERFLCADALARRLTAMGYDCVLPGMHQAVEALLEKGMKISGGNLAAYAEADDVRRALTWSEEIDRNVGRLTEIGLTPGLKEFVLEAFRDRYDLFVVTTADRAALPAIMEKEGVDYMKRYIGHETATKDEALVALAECGYRSVFMFGDSVEDQRATDRAKNQIQGGVPLLFVPVIPDDEAHCFEIGNEIITCADQGELEKAQGLSQVQMDAFAGNEVSI